MIWFFIILALVGLFASRLPGGAVETAGLLICAAGLVGVVGELVKVYITWKQNQENAVTQDEVIAAWKRQRRKK